MKLNWHMTRAPLDSSGSTPSDLQGQADAAGPEAQNNLGVLYAAGGALPQDFQAAALCFRKAAGQGHALAQTNLARMYAGQQGYPKDHAESLRWFRRAANQGDPGAQFQLGLTLHRDSLAPPPAPAAHEARIEGYMWLRLAAAQGFHNAGPACERINLSMTQTEIEEGNRRAAAFVPTQEQSASPLPGQAG
jgi:TPR repeat protein